jgi:hypothetical protein
MKFLANPKENSKGRKDGSLGQPLLLFIGLLYMSIMPLGLDLNHLATRGEMVRLDFHALDGHEPFMKSLRLDTSSSTTPCAVPRFSPLVSKLGNHSTCSFEAETATPSRPRSRYAKPLMLMCVLHVLSPVVHQVLTTPSHLDLVQTRLRHRSRCLHHRLACTLAR